MQVLDLIKVQQGHHKQQWYYEFPIMNVSVVPEVQQDCLMTGLRGYSRASEDSQA